MPCYKHLVEFDRNQIPLAINETYVVISIEDSIVTNLPL